MIRILHFVHGLAKSGGLSNCVMNYYRNIDRSKIQFDFVYFRECESDFKEEIAQMGGRYFKLTEPSFNFSYYKEGKSFFESHHGEWAAIHCHALFAAFFYADIARKQGVKNVIAHAHSTVYGKGLLRSLRNYIIIRGTRIKANHYVACGEKAGRFLFGDSNFENGKVTIFNNAVDCKRSKYSEEKRRILREDLSLGDAFVVGHVGGFSIVKNHTYLLDIFKIIKQMHPNSKMLFIGGAGIASGSTREQVKEKTSHLGLKDDVLFLGVRNDIGDLLSVMDAYVLPSQFEGLPLSLVEAQVNGLPCYVSDVVTREASIGLCTFLSIQDEPEKWAKQILNFQIVNRERGTDLAKKAGFDISSEAQKLASFYYKM